MAETSDLDPALKGGRHVWPAVVVATAVAAFFFQPLMPFVEPAWFAIGGVFLSLALVLGYDAVRIKTHKGRTIGAAFVAMGSLMLIGSAVVNAALLVQQNRGQCLELELDMLSQKPKMPHSAEAFQALHCLQTLAD